MQNLYQLHVKAAGTASAVVSHREHPWPWEGAGNVVWLLHTQLFPARTHRHGWTGIRGAAIAGITGTLCSHRDREASPTSDSDSNEGRAPALGMEIQGATRLAAHGSRVLSERTQWQWQPLMEQPKVKGSALQTQGVWVS